MEHLESFFLINILGFYWQDSLGFNAVERNAIKMPSSEPMKNPIVDISKQLHNAVDNILSSYTATCASLPSTNIMIENPNLPLQQHSTQSLQTLKGGARTTTEVLRSLRRPHVEEEETLFPRISQTIFPSHSRMQENIFEYGNAPSKQYKAGVTNEEAYLLSSDGSSDGSIFPGNVKVANKWGKDRLSKTERAYTAEIEGSQSTPIDSWDVHWLNPKVSQNDDTKLKKGTCLNKIALQI